MALATHRLRSKSAAWLLALLALILPNALRAEIAVNTIPIGLPNTVVLLVRGTYNGNDILTLKSAIAEVEPGKRVVAILDSPGGSVTQGEALGRFFYDAKIPTVVLAGTLCASACTYAFLGGRDPISGTSLRILVSGAKLGFHSFGIPGGFQKKTFTKSELENLSRETQQIVYKNIIHMRHVKAPIEILKLNTGTTFDSMNFITEGDALEYGIAVLNRETGKLILPDALKKRMIKGKP